MVVSVAIYLDENYAAPATAMVRSLIENSSEQKIRLFVLAVEIKDEIRRRMEASWPKDRVDIEWIDLDLVGYETSFASVRYLTQAAYARILIDRLLPRDLDRVITLDSDGIMLADISELWKQVHRKHAVIAVRDPCFPRLKDDPSSFVQAIEGDKATPYFNSGVMLIDLKKWRELGISARCLELAKRHPGEAKIADQSLLNAVLKGEWEPLSLRWNCNRRHLAMHAYPSLRDQVYPYREVLEAIKKPGFVHFLSSRKPWQSIPFHPHRGLYFEYLQKTEWAAASVAPSDSKSPAQKYQFARLCYRQATRFRQKMKFRRKRGADLGHFCARVVHELIG